MSYRSHTAAPNRVFDHIYDPIYTTSDAKDVHKQNCMALTKSAPIHVYPVFDSFFSELGRERRNCYAYQRNILPYFPDIGHGDFKNRNSRVTGVDRPKFFSNPLSNITTINVGLMSDECLERVEEKQVVKMKTCSSQTVYRESSAQTRSYLVEAYMENGQTEVPEIVYVAELIQTETYPGLQEIEIIERSRKRRNWEISLPAIKTPEEIPKRVAAVEAFEWEQWIAREKDINECQEARLKIVTDLVAKREKANRDATNQKLENSRKRILEERKRKKNALIREYQRGMRFLANKQRNLTCKKDDVILQHYDKKVEYTLPKLKLDVITKHRSNFEYSTEFEEKFSSIERENSAIKDLQKYLKPRRQIWLPKEACREVERGVWSDTYLKKLHESLRQFRSKKYSKRTLPKTIMYQESTDSSLSTPPMSALPDDSDESLYQSTVLIQKLIKGKAIQNMLYRGKDIYQELIDYIRSTHRIQEVKEMFPEGFDQQTREKERILKEYKKIEEALKSDEKLQDDLKKLQGSKEHKQLQKIERELSKLQEDRKAHALYLLAERERYQREAFELKRQESEDEVEQKINLHYDNLKSQYDAISRYLENILMEGIDRVSENPRQFIRKVAKKIDREASRSFDSETETKSRTSTECDDSEIQTVGFSEKEIYMQLLKENMVPQIFDRFKHESIKQKQQIFLDLAHRELYNIPSTPQRERDFLEVSCKDMVEEIIQKAINWVGQEFSDSSSLPKSSESRDTADILAEQIVSNILYELTMSLDISSNDSVKTSESSKSPQSTASSFNRSSDSIETRDSKGSREIFIDFGH